MGKPVILWLAALFLSQSGWASFERTCAQLLWENGVIRSASFSYDNQSLITSTSNGEVALYEFNVDRSFFSLTRKGRVCQGNSYSCWVNFLGRRNDRVVVRESVSKVKVPRESADWKQRVSVRSLPDFRLVSTPVEYDTYYREVSSSHRIVNPDSESPKVLVLEGTHFGVVPISVRIGVGFV